MRDRYPFLVIIVFIGLLLIPLRTLELNPNAIEETFYPRSRLIAWTSNLRLAIGDRVFPKVLVGENGWLLYTAEGEMEDYQKTDLFTDEELSVFQQHLDSLSARYAEEGITLLVVIAPAKNTIYPERVPAQIPVLGSESRLDQLVSYLQANGQNQIIDVRHALLAAKADKDVYYATDTHWNDYGAYIAYSAILRELNKNHPNLVAHPESDFEVTVRSPEPLDLSTNMGATSLPESRIQFAPRFDLHTTYKNINLGGRRLMFSYNPDVSLPNLILYYDSFFFRVIPLLGEHFHNGIYVQNYTGGGLWNLSWVEEQKPDVVIIEFSERYIRDLPVFIDPAR